MPITPRREVYAAYWHLAAERQRVFYRRLRGYPAPWTEDEIIKNHRFCNSFRASDRVSQYLIRRVIYGEHLSRDPRDIIFRILLFRFFNQESTWDLLESLYGDPKISNFDVDTWYKGMDTGQGLFNGAFMTCGIKTHGYDKKHGNYLGLVHDMVGENLPERILVARSLAEVYRALNEYTLVGKFLSYQIATDLNYSGVVMLDDNSFTMAGPGAVRGIEKVFADTGGKSPEYLIEWMRDRQEAEFLERGVPLDIAWLWGHALQNIDIQNLFCETDKYSREKFPELSEGGPKKIKQGFKEHVPGLRLGLFYPPKWGINDKLNEIPAVPDVARPKEDDLLGWFS